MPLLGFLLIFVTAYNQCLDALPRTLFKKIFHYSVYLLIVTYSIRSFTVSIFVFYQSIFVRVKNVLSLNRDHKIGSVKRLCSNQD